MQKIEVILLQDIKKLGKKYDIVKVAPVYARNVLFPSTMAKFASPWALHDLRSKIASNKKQMETISEKVKSMISSLSESGLSIEVEANDQHKLYWNIHAKDIAKKLSDQFDFDVAESWIDMKDIDTIWSYTINIDGPAKGDFKLEIVQK